MIIGLGLLVNVSFKMIAAFGLVFAASSLLCPVIAALYLWMLTTCPLASQRQVLNQALMALYLFSIGIYLLLNLPVADDTRDNIAYQIVFDDLPRKFFASTLAFAVSFYLPHSYFLIKKSSVLRSSRQRLLLALAGGVVFFNLNFLFLFTSPLLENFGMVYFDSMLIMLAILLFAGIIYLGYFRCDNAPVPEEELAHTRYSLYHYLSGFSVIILLICLACEYRLVSLGSGMALAASSILLPLLMMASNLVGELFGYQANKRLIRLLLLAALGFDLALMLVVTLPSPECYNLNLFYHLTLPRRIPAAILAIVLAFGSNAWLLDALKNSLWSQSLRLFVANTVANSLLCFVTYTVLFSGVYPGEQILDLAINAWIYKVVISVLGLPLILWACRVVSSTNHHK